VQGNPAQGFVALVEPRVTMEQLVDTLLPFGLVPPVVPEFKHITVGGSIAGVAGESSSYKYGFFHDTCVSYEVSPHSLCPLPHPACKPLHPEIKYESPRLFCANCTMESGLMPLMSGCRG
jgi:hypothetical protein